MKNAIITTLTLLSLIICIYWFFSCSEINNYKQKGEDLVKIVELYKIENGKLPNTIKDIELNLEMGEGPYYEKIDSNLYYIYFNIGFDNKYIYKSDVKLWKKEP